MTRVCVVCEGPTEVDFVNTSLAPYLAEAGLRAFPSILRARSGQHRGGRVSVDRVCDFLASEYHSSNRITTLVDFYGFRDRDNRTVEELERDILDCVVKRNPRVDRRFVLPYVQMHEFEGLLFSDVEHLDPDLGARIEMQNAARA